MENKYIKVLIVLGAICVVFLFGLIFGYAYIAREVGGIFQVETWQNLFYQLRNFFS
ncbi:hypothetical protein [Natranaerofaba carboxydovora]|uniref:hypothetical protein n=1 Tax=Natranaerofaba carboxydovora TaxID=2742683 RepID=UPI001F140AC2|nr:hypothetical protein [Natranaerofaba carboxydovora]UMZ73582.1 hypothetical protein ACONDI_01139 [Natranaerofaba carboxydovora]